MTRLPEKGRSPSSLARILVRGALLVLGLVAVSGCSGILEEDEHDRLRSALDLWESRGPQAYQLTFRWTCFCAGTQPVVIRVKGDSVTDVRPAREGNTVPLPTAEYRTVNGLFDDLREWLDRAPHESRMEFHDRFGYPTDVFVDFEENVADEELGFRISDLRPLDGYGR